MAAADKAAAGQEPASTGAVRPGVMFSQTAFADEVADWLQNRATSTEVERFHRYTSLIGAAAGPATSKSAPSVQQNTTKPRPASSLGFSTTKSTIHTGTALSNGTNHNRPGTASPSTWSHTFTKAAAGQLTSSPGTAPADGLTGQPLKQHSSAVATDLQQPAGKSRSRSAAAATRTNDTSRCVNVTTAQAFHGLKELYPDLWANTVPICRPGPAPNKNFISEWGESLKQGASEAWAPFLATTYQLANLQVAKPTDEFAVCADEALIDWAAKQKLYYGDMLTSQAAAAVKKLLEGKQHQQQQQQVDASVAAAGVGAAAELSVADKKGLVEMLRQVNAVVLPDSTKSMCHTLHKPQYSVENTETTSLMKEQTRIKTMGFPRKVEVKGFAHTAPRASASSRAASAGPTVGRGSTRAGIPSNEVAASSSGIAKAAKGPRAADMIDTFNSKVPLKWAASAVHAPTSSYTASYGGNPGHAPQMLKTVSKEVNVGFGHVDQHQYCSTSGVYPVEQLYLQTDAAQGHEHKETDMKTTQRMSYKPRDAEDIARSIVAAREQIEASQAARNKSFIPLSKAGIQLGSSAQWRSSYAADFIPCKVDLSANKAMANAVAGMFNGPTIAFGKIAGMRAQDLDKIAKHKAEQEAAAAARAQLDAELYTTAVSSQHS